MPRRVAAPERPREPLALVVPVLQTEPLQQRAEPGLKRELLPDAGLNVYDILRRHKLVLTKAAVDALEARFK